MLSLKKVSRLPAVLTFAYLILKVSSQSSVKNIFRFHSDVGQCTSKNETNPDTNSIRPTITWTSEHIQDYVSPEHVVISGFDMNLKDSYLVTIACKAPYPVEIIYEEANLTTIKDPTDYTLQSTGGYPLPYAISSREGHTKYEQTQDIIYVIWIYFTADLIKRQPKMLFQCNSVKNPCSGTTVRVSYDSEDRTLTIKTKDIQVNYEKYSQKEIRVKDRFISTDKITSCKANFYHIITHTAFHNGFAYPAYYFACELANGQPGKTSVINTYTTSVVHNSFKHIDVQPTKCWNFIQNASAEPNTCKYCPKIVWPQQFPVILVCENPYRINRNLQNQKNEIGAYMISGIRRVHLLGNTEKYLLNQDITIDSIILMGIVYGNQVVNSTITVKCSFHAYYFGGPFGFAEEYKSYGDDNTGFISRSLTAPNFRGENAFETYNTVRIKSAKLERVYCLGHLQREGQWVNVSLALNVSQPLYPAFINTLTSEDDTKKRPNNENSVSGSISNIYFEKNDINKNITCEVTGHPFPNITWTRFNNEFKETRGGFNNSESFPYSWSEIQFKQITPSTGGDYVCRAHNDLGQVQKVFRVIVNNPSSSQTAVIAVSVVVAGMLVVFAATFFVQLRKIRKQRQVIRNLTLEEIQEFFDGNPNMNENDPHFNVFSQAFNPKLNILKDHLILKEGKLLGSGNFGTVMQAYLILNQGINVGQVTPGFYLSPKMTVAVKTVKSNVDVVHVKSLLSEIKIMAYLDNHPNIVRLLGTVTEHIKNNEILMAVEFCGNGDLKKYLETHRDEFKNMLQLIKSNVTAYENVPVSNTGTDSTLSVENQTVPRTELPPGGPKCTNHSTLELLGWATDIANGMAYLSQKRIIHGDLAARNILLTDKHVAKISDFGLSRVLKNDYTIYSKKTETPLPWKWLAIESLRFQQFSLKSDVWSFGVILWEIFSIAQTPYPGLYFDHEFMDRIQQGYRLEQPEFANTELYTIMIGCWDKDPEQRPDICLIYAKLGDFADRLTRAVTL